MDVSGGGGGAAAASARKRPRTSTGVDGAQQQDDSVAADSLGDFKGTPQLRAAVAHARGLVKARFSPGWFEEGEEDGPPVGLEAQTAQVEALLRKALEQGLHEPFLLVGPRGSGKSRCLEAAFQALRRRYASQGGRGGTGTGAGGGGASSSRPFRAIYVDGSLEGTDVAAIAEIASQLEMSKALDTSRKAVGGGGAKGGGRAGRGARQQLDFIVEGMRSGTFEETPLVFVIDHIEAFAPSSASHQGLSTHRKQLLLYSLMDLQHRSDLRFVVLGLSSELDVLDRFEKRIRSRISNKQIFFPACPPLPELMQIFGHAFHLPAPSEEDTQRQPTEAANSSDNTPSPALVLEARRRHAAAFNAGWARIRPAVEQLLEWPHKLGRPLRWFATLGYRIAAGLDEERQPVPTLAMFRAAVEAQASHLTATSRQLFASLANLELLVVIAMKRLADRGRERCTLDMVWAEYEAFLRQEPLLPCRYSRPVLHKGLLNVLALGLASVAQRIPPGGQGFLQHQPPPDKDFSTLDAADVGTAPLCLEFHPGDLQEYLQEHEREIPTLLARWGASWAE